jgi:hypothetical protein
MRVFDLLLSIDGQLGDNKPNAPFRRYPLADLVTYYNEAMCFVASHRPDLFTDMRLMKLATGSHQNAKCCGCTDIQGVVSQVDAEGNQVKDLTTVNQSADSAKVSRWYRSPCRVLPDGTTAPVIVAVSIDSQVAGAFTVQPPIPPDVDAWVKVRCTHPPKGVDIAAVMGGASAAWCKFLPAVRSYILYRALQGDRHAAGAVAESQAELKAAYTYLGVQVKMEEKQES